MSARPEVVNQSPFFHYNRTFDALEIMKRHQPAHLEPTEGFLTNFLGVLIDPKFFPPLLKDRGGTVEPLPNPSNWHADLAEWGAALRAVDIAGETFTAVELGCGWACWLNNTGVAARRAGRKVRLIGIEGDETYIGYAHEALQANGFQPDEFTIHRGVASARPGHALFPRQQEGGESWGLQAIYEASEEQIRAAEAEGTHDILDRVPLAELFKESDRIDLLHIDIQGAEADLIADSIETLNEKVVYLVVGTHSRQIEGRIFDTLLSAGWVLEIERPAIFTLTPDGPVIRVDGVQGWRNQALAS